jgi:hypothetical protein
VQRRVLAAAELVDASAGRVALEEIGAQMVEVAAVEDVRGHSGDQDLATVTGCADARRNVDGGAEVALRPFVGLAGVQPDLQPRLDPSRPGLAAHLHLQLRGPRGGVVRPVERRPEGLTAGGEDEPALPDYRCLDQRVEAGHRRGHLRPVCLPELRRALDDADAEGHRPRGTASTRARRNSSAQLLVLVEDPGLEVPQAGAGLHPEALDEVPPCHLERRKGICLPSDPVQGGHQHRPEAFPEGVVRGELGQRAESGLRIGLEAAFEVGLQCAQPLLYQRVDHGVQTRGV